MLSSTSKCRHLAGLPRISGIVFSFPRQTATLCQTILKNKKTGLDTKDVTINKEASITKFVDENTEKIKERSNNSDWALDCDQEDPPVALVIWICKIKNTAKNNAATEC